MLKFHTVSHQVNTDGGEFGYERKAFGTLGTDYFDNVKSNNRHIFNPSDEEFWGCDTLQDYCRMRYHVQEHPLKSWNYAKRFGAEGAAAGAGLGAIVALGLGLACWPIALAGGVVAGYSCAVTQYGVLESAERFDKAVEKLGQIASDAISEQITRADLSSLQEKVRECRSEFKDLGAAFFRLSSRLEEILEKAKTNRWICRDHMYS